MTAFDDVKVWSLMMDVVEVVRPSMVCYGCCWHLSPASTTTDWPRVEAIEGRCHGLKDGG